MRIISVKIIQRVRYYSIKPKTRRRQFLKPSLYWPTRFLMLCVCLSFAVKTKSTFSAAHVLQSLNESSPSLQKHSVPLRNARGLLSALLNLRSPFPVVNLWEVKYVWMKTCTFILSSLLLAKAIILPGMCVPYDGTVKAFSETWIKSTETEQESKRVCVSF